MRMVKNWGQISHFLTPVGSGEGWAKLPSGRVEFGLRLNLRHTFDGRPLGGVRY